MMFRTLISETYKGKELLRVMSLPTGIEHEISQTVDKYIARDVVY